MGWTQQQENAINARSCSVIVSAAAGSGKTAVLTERLGILLADEKLGISADSIVVVTFTNDAASELKKRLDVKLRTLINDDPGNKWLRQQQVLLQSANISTINSFCFDLLRDNITDQGITSGFGVLDEAAENVIMERAMEELINSYSSDNYDKISYMFDNLCFRDERRLADVIREADRFLSSVAFRDEWLDNMVGEYKKDFESSVYYRLLCSQCINILKYALRLAESNLAMVPDIFPDTKGVKAAAATLAQAQADTERIEDILSVFRNNGFPNEDEADRAMTFGDRKPVSKKVECDRELLDIYAARRKKFTDTVKAVIRGCTSAKADYSDSARVAELLAEMLRSYQALVWEMKAEKNSISFDDGERLALELLSDRDENGHIVQSETAKRLSQQYSIIMIDEYQDSNNKEDMIFKLLSRDYHEDENGVPMYGSNVFLVGDVKQSIYGFRLANPKNFLSTLRRSAPYDKESTEMNQSIFLNKNFRSSPEVIDFINYIFSGIMSESCGDVEYNEDEMLYFGAGEYGEKDDSRTAEICLIPETDNDVTVSGNSEAACIAEKIAEMIRNGTEVVQKNVTRRPCQPSDFTILMRNNKPTADYAAELEHRGIPAKSSEEQGYLTSKEISVLLDLLRVINNPLLDIPLAAVMTSPMYAFSVEELAYIRSFDKQAHLFSLLRTISKSECKGFSDMILEERCRNFLEALDDFRLSSITMTIPELITSIYDETDFIAVMQSYIDGDRKRANLRALVQYAQEYERSAVFDISGGLGGFIRFIDRVLENGMNAENKTSAPSGDYVTVQTLHKSKGLEYPFVFIAETHTQFKKASGAAMFSADGRAGFILTDKKLTKRYKTFQYNMLTAEKNRELSSESMRLFYVGLTRAKQRLFIDLRCSEKYLKRVGELTEQCVLDSGRINNLVQNGKSFSDWVWSAIMVHECFGDMAEATGIDYSVFGLPPVSETEKLFNWEILSCTGEKAIEDAAEEKAAEPDDEICKKINKYIEFEYDMELSQLPARLSVTQLTHKQNDGKESIDFELRRPGFMFGKSKMTGAERGTAIHTFFQYCDFELAQSDLKAELERMTDRGFLTKAEAGAVTEKDVNSFFESELYKRLSKAENTWRERKFMAAAAELGTDFPLADKFKGTDGMVKGIIDLVFEEPDGLVVADYKTDKGVNEEELIKRYTSQLMLYRSAVELTSGKKVKELLIYSFYLKKCIRVKM
ncbi:MAG: helicase-exonuclease AddAB subunit AddA [Ruminococcus sp.]|nr:helicase-exonuclease AddAB subunit AddA [Ruminococcus sp.]